jgi:hypothetical protein
VVINIIEFIEDLRAVAPCKHEPCGSLALAGWAMDSVDNVVGHWQRGPVVGEDSPTGGQAEEVISTLGVARRAQRNRSIVRGSMLLL